MNIPRIVLNSDIEEYPVFNILENRGLFLFKIIYLVHYIFNDFLILAITFYVDILLVIVIKKDLKKKKNFKRKAKSKNKIDDEEVKKNLKKMIIYTLIVIAFCRLPELSLYLFMLFFNFSTTDSVDLYKNRSMFDICQIDLCPLLINIIQFMYHCSYLTNLFFCYKFNKNFRRAFREFFHLNAT